MADAIFAYMIKGMVMFLLNHWWQIILIWLAFDAAVAAIKKVENFLEKAFTKWYAKRGNNK